MANRICYVKYIPSINGRESLIGRLLYDHLSREFEVDLADCIVSTEVVGGVYNLHPDRFQASEFEAIYIEGGLYWGGGLNAVSKVELEVLSSFVQHGGVAVVADVDRNAAGNRRESSPYWRSVEIFGTAPDWGPSGTSLRYGIDSINNLDGDGAAVFARPERMAITPWLQPVFRGIDQILVVQPLALQHMGVAQILASGNLDSSRVLADDLFVNVPSQFMFAAVRQHGLGYVVLITGCVSGDQCIERCPDNALWVSKLLQLLIDEARRERGRHVVANQNERQLTLSQDDWAAALGQLAEDQSLVEARLRELIASRLLGEEKRRGEAGWAEGQILAAVDENRRTVVRRDSLQAALESMYWLETVAVVTKNWGLFERIFADKREFQDKAKIINDRPHAHAKTIDRADLALYRRELQWFRANLDAKA